MALALSFYILVSCFYSSSGCSTFTASTNATATSDQSLSASTTQLSYSAPTVIESCTSDSRLTTLCEECDTYTITVGQHRSWQVSCGRFLIKANYTKVEHISTIGQCIDACEQSQSCFTPGVSPHGTCFLMEPGYDKEGRPIGHYVERQGWAALWPGPSNGGLPDISGSLFHPLSSKTSTTSTAFPSRTSASASSCQASSISCPRCNGAHVKDSHGKTYHVLCGSDLYSERYSSVEQWLTPEGCMADCDKFAWCGGSTYSEGRKCELAKGQDVFPQGRPGYTAFLSINPTYTPPPGHLSAFPTGNPTSAKSLSATPTVTACSIDDVRCRQCDGATVVDGFNETYRVQCNFQPICNDITGRTGYTSQNSCMEHCDTDVTCLAAIWYNGHCDLCQGALEGLVTYESPHEYVVFIADPFLKPPKPTFSSYPPAWSSHSLQSLTTSGSARLSTTSTLRIAITSATSKRPTIAMTPTVTQAIDIGSVKCPVDDGRTAVDPSNRRHFEIRCSVSLGAEGHHVTSASNFAACAESCTGQCDGFEFGSQTICELFTEISAESFPMSGVTAGFPISVPPRINGGYVATVTSANDAHRK